MIATSSATSRDAVAVPVTPAASRALLGASPFGGGPRRADGSDGYVPPPLLDAASAADADDGAAFEEAQTAHARYGSGALRAAVFGFSDGVVSTISLLLGVHAERKTAGGPHASAAETHAHLVAVALTGVAGLLAGAASMACGEWVSMSTQAEALAGQLAVERSHLVRFPAHEAAEFAAYLRAKGVRAALADAVADDVANGPGGVDAALDIHARFEHGIDPEELGAPLASAVSSYVAFALGAAVPLAPWLVAAFAPRLLPGGGRDDTPALVVSLVLAAAALALAGGCIAYSVTGGGAGAPPARRSSDLLGSPHGPHGAALRAALGRRAAGATPARVVAWGALRQVAVAAVAASTTYAVGVLLGAHVT